MGNAESVFNQGVEAFDRGNYEDAAELMREAIEANPEHLDAKVNLGLQLCIYGSICLEINARTEFYFDRQEMSQGRICDYYFCYSSKAVVAGAHNNHDRHNNMMPYNYLMGLNLRNLLMAS